MSVQSKPPQVLLTRPEDAARAFAATLPAGVGVILSPLLRIEMRDLEDALPDGADLIFTSKQGVAALRRAAPDVAGRAICVGDATRAAAQAAGFQAVSAGRDADALVALILRDHADRRFVHIRGQHTRGDVVPRLQAAGIAATDRILYDQIPQPLTGAARDLLAGDIPVLVPLFSPRSAHLFAKDCPRAPRAELFCLSPAVADAAAQGDYAAIQTLIYPDANTMHAALSRRIAGTALEGGTGGPLM